MAEITPFRGLRYDIKKLGGVEPLGGIAPLVAPPYDVISPALQEDLYARHEKNVVRLDFGKKYDADTDADNRYTRSAGYLKQWLADGVLVREGRPCLYFYEVSYKTPSGTPKTMSGFICMLRLEEWSKGVVLPHESTLKGPKADRMELMKATGVSASQIFSLYSDKACTVTGAMKKAIGGRPADEEAADDDGAVHRLWVVEDPAAIETVRRDMMDRPVFIADGHHRYETALAFRDHCRANGGGDGKETYNYVPMFLANMEEDGLTVLPTHRMIKDAGGRSLENILAEAEKFFDVRAFSFTPADEGRVRADFLAAVQGESKRTNAYGFYFGRGSSYYLLTLKDVDPLVETLRCQRSETYCKLDVSILHNLVIERVLGINTEKISQDQPVQFEKDGDRAIGRVASGEFAMCFILNATKVHEVKEVALAREIMPQKSTYFYPKLLTGLVIAPLVD
ncbi:MAG: DUF1015 domain-containing protein [Nitrospirae bacterium]|nr:DUF1015 domain-containing protein [Nitrospirota bacterium]